MSEISTRKAAMTACTRCQKRWGGLNTAHCTACHHTFTGIAAFDKHRDGSHSHGTRHCVSPESVGLVEAGRAYPCWGYPRGEGWADDAFGGAA